MNVRASPSYPMSWRRAALRRSTSWSAGTSSQITCRPRYSCARTDESATTRSAAMTVRRAVSPSGARVSRSPARASARRPGEPVRSTKRAPCRSASDLPTVLAPLPGAPTRTVSIGGNYEAPDRVVLRRPNALLTYGDCSVIRLASSCTERHDASLHLHGVDEAREVDRSEPACRVATGGGGSRKGEKQRAIPRRRADRSCAACAGLVPPARTVAGRAGRHRARSIGAVRLPMRRSDPRTSRTRDIGLAQMRRPQRPSAPAGSGPPATSENGRKHDDTILEAPGRDGGDVAVRRMRW